MPRRFDPHVIRETRLERHWTQQELGARASGWSQRRISRLELGLTTPTPDDLEVLRVALELPAVDSFFRIVQTRRPQLRVIEGRRGASASA